MDETDSLMRNTGKGGFLPQRYKEGTKCTKFFGTPIGEMRVILKISFTRLLPEFTCAELCRSIEG